MSRGPWTPPLASWGGVESDGGPPLSPATPCPSARAHGKATRQPTPRTAQSGPPARLAVVRPAARLGRLAAHRAVPQGALSGGNALELYDGIGNGRITCAEARAHGIAPVPRGHPAYQYMNDRDNDGIVCE